MALPDIDSSVGHSFGLEFDLINARLKTLERGSLKAKFLIVLPGRDRVLVRQIERSRR
jgi:hypothetical protein